jgi:tetratricopeptide (TPR) repeat protein
MAPMSAAPHHNLGVLLASLGRLDEAVEALRRAADLAPQDAATRRALADTHYNIGVRHARRQRWSEAVASYETAIGFDRLLPEAFNGAGIALRRLHDDHAAVAMFDEALRLRPSFAEARYNLAGALAALGRYAEAMESCRTALELRPKLREAIQLLDSLQRTLMPDLRLAGA